MNQEHLDKIKFMKNIRQNIQKSVEWLEQRKTKLTSSDAATALGVNPYEKPIKLLFKKNNCGPPFVGNIATRHGEKYESEAIDIYCKLMNKTNFELGLIEWDSINPIRKKNEELDKFVKDNNISLSFLAGSPDGVAIDNENMEDLILLEVKCPFTRNIKFGKCPEYYEAQIQLNMAILDIEKADFIEYNPANVEPKFLKEPIFNITRINRDYNWFYKNVPILYNFWNDVLFWRKNNILQHPLYDKYAYKSKCIEYDEDENYEISPDITFRD